MSGVSGVSGVGLPGPDNPLLSDALIRSRDGITGTWQPPGAPTPLEIEDPANLDRWAPAVRASVFDFELFSRVGFSAAAGANGEAVDPVSLWHLQVTPGGSGPPAAQYQPLVRFTRPGTDIFQAQVNLVDNYADLRPDRLAEITAQLGGAEAFLASVATLHPSRNRWTLELLATAARFASFTEMRIKHALACRRPGEYSPQVQPVILTPAHGALPSGHAAETFMMGLVLWTLMRAGGAAQPHWLWGLQLMQLAARVAINRQVAGVHTPVESAAGTVLGLALGQYMVERCTGGGTYQAWTFDGPDYPPLQDFTWTELYDVKLSKQSATVYAKELPVPQAAMGARSAILEWLWTRAAAEWP